MAFALTKSTFTSEMKVDERNGTETYMLNIIIKNNKVGEKSL